MVTESVSTPDTVVAVGVIARRRVNRERRRLGDGQRCRGAGRGVVDVPGEAGRDRVSLLTGWSTVAMVQLTFPLASVVPLQDCAVVPEPMVKVTTLVGSGVPVVGVSVVSVPDRVVGWPLTAVVGPV